jgi:pyridoxal phosphate enzyme (YggS family)
VRLIAVSKGVDPALIADALSAGIADIGENRVQEAMSKRQGVSEHVTWHMLGHVQSNKASRVAGTFDVVQSVHDSRIARLLADQRRPGQPPLDVLVEVDLTDIPGRTGVRPDGVDELVAGIAALPNLQVRGLMTIAPPGAAAEARRCFRRLRELRAHAVASTGVALDELSMGMTDDFEVAVEEGATMVRVGRGIFGERH